MANATKILKKTGRIFLYIFLGILALVLLLFIFINLPVGKRVVKNQVTSYLQKKLKTKVEIGAVDYSLPKWLKIENVYIEDQQKDTLIFGEELSVDLNMLKLIRGNTDIKKVSFKNISIHVNRAEKDSFFNYQFIIDAFSGNKPSTPNMDTAEMKLTMDRLIFDNVGLKFNDQFGGTDFSAHIKKLDLKMNKFQPDRVKFLIDDFYADGVDFYMNTYKESLPVAEEKNTDTAKTTSYGLYITANKIDLRDVNVSMDNKISGLYYGNKVTHLGATNLLFNLDQSVGIADALLLDSSSIVFSAPKTVVDPVKKDSAVAPKTPWLFETKQLAIRHSKIKYDDNNKKAAEGLDFSHLDVDHLNTFISAFKFSDDTTRANISQFSFADKSGFKLDTTHINFLMTDTMIAASDIYIKTPNSLIQRSFQLTFDSLSGIKSSPQNSFISGAFTNTSVAFNDIYMLVPALKASLPPAQFANQRININTELRGSIARLYLPYFQLSGLSGSRISARGTLYNLSDPKKFAYDLYIDESNFLKSDLMKFVPPANQQQLANLPPVFNLQGHFTGTTNDITADLNTTAKDFGLNGHFLVKNISDPAKLQFDAQIKHLTLDKNFITGFLPPDVLAQLNLPQKINASGKLEGNTNNITTDLKVATSYGGVAIKGYVKNIKDTKNANYDLGIITPGFNVGTLIKQDSVLGRVAGKFSARGTGFDYKTMRSVIKADVAGLEYNGHDYKNALIDATLNNGVINSVGSINDSSLNLNYTIDANVKDKYPTFSGVIKVDTAQLQKLNLYKDTLNFSGTLTVDSKSLQPRSLNASAVLDSAHIQLGKDIYGIDSMSLVATSENGIDSIKLWAPFAELTAGGAFDYDKIGASLQRYIGNYYSFPGAKDTLGSIPDQQLAFNGVIRQSPIVTGLVPGLVRYDDINFSGSYASADTDSALNFKATIPVLQFQANRVAAGDISIASKNERINYEIKFDTLVTPAKTLFGTYIRGAAAHDSISLNARTKDDKDVDWFGISGDAYVRDEVYSFRMKDSLLLNYEKWNVASDNYISYSDQGIIVNNFLLTSDTSKIFIKSRELVNNSPIDIDIDNFNLKSISSLTSGDTLFAAGVLDVKASVSELDKTLPAFTGNASINGLEIMQHALGNVTAFAEKQSENNIAAKMSLEGFGNDLKAKGNYYLNDEQQQFDAELAINKLNFQTIEAFSAGALKNSTGNIRGNITANGKFADPRWKGELNFDTTKFTLTQLGTPYNINNQKIVLDYPKVSFPNFTITDSLNHTLRVNGFVGLKTMSEFDLGVDVNATDFILVNAPKAINSQFYGFASIDANVSVTGTSTAPQIEGDIYLNDKSNVFIVLPEKSYAKDEGTSIVRFIDRDTFDINPPVVAFEEATIPESQFGKFLNYNLNIEVTKEAALTIIIDPVTQDEIKVQGDAQLNAGVDPGGNIVLAGNYELDKGYYNLHYQFLQRKFDLQKGSTIAFAGAPMDARIDITAAYQLETSAKELLSSEVSDNGGTIGNAMNQKLPFKVVLKLTGVLSKPIINFDIQLDEKDNTIINSELQTAIENKLTQLRGDEAATNKQVFSMLLFGRFVSEQSSDFFKGNGTNFSDIARQSVSQFLSGALNQIAGDLFKGINVDLNLNSYNDYTTGGSQQRTDLNVAVSKQFLNDRLTVTVGKNFGVEGQDAVAKAGNDGSPGFSPDITLTYKLTADGKYLVRAYTKNQFEVTVDGYVIENGVAFIITMDYDKFNELFRRKKSKKTK